MQNITFKAGDTIITEGDEGNSAFFIVEGSVEVIVGKDGDAKNVGELQSGEVFGEMSLIESGPRSATIKAVTDTECTVTTYEEFVKTLQDNPEQAIQFMETLVQRLRQMNQMITSMDTKKRRLRDIFNDWATSSGDFDATDRNWTDQDEKTHYAMMHPWVF